MYHYAGNNPVKYIDPTGQWIDNGDGTYTAEKGDTLWKLYGDEWREKSGYEGDPTKLQIGDVVGKRSNSSTHNQQVLSTTPLAPSVVQELDKSEKLKENLNKVGDVLSYVSISLNIASVVCLCTGNVAMAEILDLAAAGCDIAAAGLYLASGDEASAALSLASTLMDFVPGPYKFNKGANRFISSTTGKFVSNTLGRQAGSLPKIFGLGLNFLNTK